MIIALPNLQEHYSQKSLAPDDRPQPAGKRFQMNTHIRCLLLVIAIFALLGAITSSDIYGQTSGTSTQSPQTDVPFSEEIDGPRPQGRWSIILLWDLRLEGNDSYPVVVAGG